MHIKKFEKIGAIFLTSTGGFFLYCIPYTAEYRHSAQFCFFLPFCHVLETEDPKVCEWGGAGEFDHF